MDPAEPSAESLLQQAVLLHPALVVKLMAKLQASASALVCRRAGVHACGQPRNYVLAAFHSVWDVAVRIHSSPAYLSALGDRYKRESVTLIACYYIGVMHVFHAYTMRALCCLCK